MKLYSVKRKIEGGHDTYDEYRGHVVAALHPTGAKALCAQIAGDEGKACWASTEAQLIGEYTGPNKKPFIVLSDFHHA